MRLKQIEKAGASVILSLYNRSSSTLPSMIEHDLSDLLGVINVVANNVAEVVSVGFDSSEVTCDEIKNRLKLSVATQGRQ